MPNRLKYILSAIALVLLLVGGAELYYIFLNKAPVKQSDQTSTTQPIPSSSSNPNSPSKIPFSNIVQRYLYVTTNSAATVIILNTQYKGKIVELDTNGGVEKTLNNFSYDVLMRIKGSGEIASTVLLAKNDMPKVKVVQLINGQENPINFSDLKVGDTITFDLTEDRIKDNYNNLINAKIVKQ